MKQIDTSVSVWLNKDLKGYSQHTVMAYRFYILSLCDQLGSDLRGTLLKWSCDPEPLLCREKPWRGRSILPTWKLSSQTVWHEWLLSLLCALLPQIFYSMIHHLAAEYKFQSLPLTRNAQYTCYLTSCFLKAMGTISMFIFALYVLYVIRHIWNMF